MTGLVDSAEATNRWVAVLREDADFMMDVFTSAAHEWYEDKQYCAARIDCLDEKVEDLRRYKSQAQKDIADAEKCISQMAVGWANGRSCTHCPSTFVPIPIDEAHKFVLRCKWCGLEPEF